MHGLSPICTRSDLLPPMRYMYIEAYNDLHWHRLLNESFLVVEARTKRVIAWWSAVSAPWRIGSCHYPMPRFPLATRCNGCRKAALTPAYQSTTSCSSNGTMERRSSASITISSIDDETRLQRDTLTLPSQSARLNCRAERIFVGARLSLERCHL